MERIALRTQLSTGVNWDEVREVLSSALRNETELADARRTYFERACHAFEQQYQMSSEEFMQQFESGVLGDDADYFDWYAAKRGLDLQESRLERPRLLPIPPFPLFPTTVTTIRVEFTRPLR